jgi:hypothetical protein
VSHAGHWKCLLKNLAVYARCVLGRQGHDYDTHLCNLFRNSTAQDRLLEKPWCSRCGREEPWI